jgi:hypothetical protein
MPLAPMGKYPRRVPAVFLLNIDETPEKTVTIALAGAKIAMTLLPEYLKFNDKRPS